MNHIFSIFCFYVDPLLGIMEQVTQNLNLIFEALDLLCYNRINYFLNTFLTQYSSIIYIYIYIYIIITSCRHHRYPWPSIATFPYRLSPPAGLLGYILCPHIAAECKFGLVVLLLLGHMWGSIVVRHLRAHLCFSSSVRRVWLVWPV